MQRPEPPKDSIDGGKGFYVSQKDACSAPFFLSVATLGLLPAALREPAATTALAASRCHHAFLHHSDRSSTLLQSLHLIRLLCPLRAAGTVARDTSGGNTTSSTEPRPHPAGFCAVRKCQVSGNGRRKPGKVGKVGKNAREGRGEMRQWAAKGTVGSICRSLGSGNGPPTESRRGRSQDPRPAGGAIGGNEL